MRPAAYVPVDISSAHLESSAKTLQSDYAWLNVYAVCADYSQDLQLPDEIPLAQPMAFFPGSSVGNFAPRGAQLFLERVRKVVGDAGKLLIGVDRRKDASVLEAAYNDAQGVTAQFNLNLLTHLNRKLGADFDLGAFTHEASYDVDKGRIQMFLVAQRAQRVNVAGESIEFAAGARIHTENSYKYDPQDFVELAAAAGFSEELHFTDSKEYFSVFLFAAS
jgi:dimethylhistidine N-methyltransferase